MRALSSFILALLLVQATGCKRPTAPNFATERVLTNPSVPSPPTALAAAGALVTGRVLAPKTGIVAGGGGNLIGIDGASLIGIDGASVTGRGASALTRGLLAIETSPLTGAEVFLADAGGNPIPGLASVRTDGEGRYALTGVPPGYTFLVIARFKDSRGTTGSLRTVVQTTSAGSTADVSAASTMVAAAVVSGKASTMGTFNPATFTDAVEATGRQLVSTELPDFTDRAAVLAKMNGLVTATTALKASIGELTGDLAATKVTLAEIQAKVAEIKSPTVATSPSPLASEAPSAPLSTTPVETTAPAASSSPGVRRGPVSLPLASPLQTGVIQPGGLIEHILPVSNTLTLQVRADATHARGFFMGMAITVNGASVPGNLLNKELAIRLKTPSAGVLTYHQPVENIWSVFLSPNYLAHDGLASKGFQVVSDPGQAYLYRWDISALKGQGTTMAVKVFNRGQTTDDDVVVPSLFYGILP